MEVLPQLGKFSLSTIDIKKRVYKFFGYMIVLCSILLHKEKTILPFHSPKNRKVFKGEYPYIIYRLSMNSF
jgi:hypothetical protein